MTRLSLIDGSSLIIALWLRICQHLLAYGVRNIPKAFELDFERTVDLSFFYILKFIYESETGDWIKNKNNVLPQNFNQNPNLQMTD